MTDSSLSLVTSNPTTCVRKKSRKKNIILFKNGDSLDMGRRYSIGASQFVSWEQFLTAVTVFLKPVYGKVKKMYDASTGELMTEVVDLLNGFKYVAAADEPFKMSTDGYRTKEERMLDISSQKQAVDHLVINVFGNGIHKPSAKFVLTKNDLYKWDATLQSIGKILPDAAYDVKGLYTLEGRRLRGPWQLTNNGYYVAVWLYKPFRSMEYLKIDESFAEKKKLQSRSQQNIKAKEKLKDKSKILNRRLLLSKLPGNVQFIIIHVFRNGEEKLPSKKFVIRSKDYDNWGGTLQFIANTLHMTAIEGLYSLSGEKMTSEQLQQNQHYVAVEYHTKFIETRYLETNPSCSLIKPRQTLGRRRKRIKREGSHTLVGKVEMYQNKYENEESEVGNDIPKAEVDNDATEVVNDKPMEPPKMNQELMSLINEMERFEDIASDDDAESLSNIVPTIQEYKQVNMDINKQQSKLKDSYYNLGRNLTIRQKINAASAKKFMYPENRGEQSFKEISSYV